MMTMLIFLLLDINSMLLQWGTKTSCTNGNTISFPTVFTNESPKVFVTHWAKNTSSNNGTAIHLQTACTSTTISTFIYASCWTSGTSSYSTNMYYMAIGY